MNEYRIIDANLNRLREALRVLEEIFRFYNNNKEAAVFIKNLRHDFSSQQKYISDFTDEFINNRDVEGDLLTKVTVETEINKKSIKEIFLANIGRITESLRVIEEFAKLFSAELSQIAKKSRYSVYEFEKRHYSTFKKQ